MKTFQVAFTAPAFITGYLIVEAPDAGKAEQIAEGLPSHNIKWDLDTLEVDERDRQTTMAEEVDP